MILAIACFIPGIILLFASVYAFFTNQGAVGAVMLVMALIFLFYGLLRMKKVKKAMKLDYFE